MDISSLHLVENSLKAISQRQQVTSANIANAHTPGYTAKELSFNDILGSLNNPFETQLAHKMNGSTAEAASTGVAVDMQKELIEMQKNTLFYSMATRRASTIISTLKTATQIGR
jgi:flagellar basal-body rod protein FlgB